MRTYRLPEVRRNRGPRNGRCWGKCKARRCRDELELAPVILLQRGKSLLAVDHLIEFDAIGPEPHLEEECGDGQVVDDEFNEQ